MSRLPTAIVTGKIALRSSSRALRRACVERLEERCFLSLSAGSPVAVTTPVAFSGVGGTNASGAALGAMQSFEAAIGGADNGGTASPQSSGFRSINWDGVKLDGTDFGGDTTVIDPGKTVGIPLNRFQERGMFFKEVYAVSGDGFADVNPSTAGLFNAFSPSNTFAMFNENTIDFSFVKPSVHTTAPVDAESRGFGAIFLNVQKANTTSIELFHGDESLGTFYVPVGTQGQAEFLGELFSNPVVTRATITLGTDVLFSFDGTHFSSSSTDNPPTSNLVVTDDFVYPEPTTDPDLPTITGTQGQTFTGTVARFFDTAGTATAASFTGIINWGDGHTSPATFAANSSGGFDVNGTNTFAQGGHLPVSVQVQQFDAGTDTIELDNVANVTALPVLPVTPKGANVNATAGATLSAVLAKFTSVSGAATADFTASISWGDGTTGDGSVVASGKTFVVTGSHTYATAGADTITVTITNAGGATYTATSHAKVKAVKGGKASIAKGLRSQLASIIQKISLE